MGRILVIDDEAEARVLLDIHLRHRGYDVLLAGDGWTGLHLYHREHPDVILLDLNMPELDGVTVLKEIRRTDLKQPVIVLTADSNPEMEQQIRALNVNKYVLKSSSMHLLEETLAHLFLGRKPKFG